MASSRFFEHDSSELPYQLPRHKHVSGIARIAERLLAQSCVEQSTYMGESGVFYALFRLLTARGVEFPLLGERSIERHSVWSHILPNVRGTLYHLRYHSERRNGWSLFCGHAGAYAVAALIFESASNVEGVHMDIPSYLRDERQRALRKFDNLAVLAGSFTTDSVGFPEDEMLYGRAGYLMGMILLKNLATPRHDAVLQVVRALLESGKFQAQRVNHPCPLYYPSPRGGRRRPYLGIAHGLMGILYALLHFREILEELREIETVLYAVRYVLQFEEDREGSRGMHGYYPIAMDSTHTPLVHWCHGSTGAVFLFVKAYEVFLQDEFLQAANRAGEVVWSKGLLKKGPGLCHGVSGNGYALLRLYKLTRKEKYLTRASRFGEFLLSEPFTEASIPDHPWSLYEGWAGALCFLIDLADPLNSNFPLFEV